MFETYARCEECPKYVNGYPEGKCLKHCVNGVGYVAYSTVPDNQAPVDDYIGNDDPSEPWVVVKHCEFLEWLIAKATSGFLTEAQANVLIAAATSGFLTEAQANHGEMSDPHQILQTFGGFEVAQICGAMLAAKQNNMIIMVDGFIATASYLVAQAINPEISENAIFCHTSNESGHQLMLDYLKAEPLVNLGMRLGEGTGCAVAYPLIKSAVAFLNGMASFESAGVSEAETA